MRHRIGDSRVQNVKELKMLIKFNLALWLHSFLEKEAPINSFRVKRNGIIIKEPITLVVLLPLISKNCRINIERQNFCMAFWVGIG